MSAEPHRPTLTERHHELVMAMANRQPSSPECSVEIGTTAKRIHTWTITVRGEDASECKRVAKRIDEELSAAYASELEESDDLAAKLAASVASQEPKK